MTFSINSRQIEKTYAGDGASFVTKSFKKQNSVESLLLKSSFGNEILDALPAEDAARLEPHLEKISLRAGDNLYEPEDEIEYVYFPVNAVVSQFYILEDGRTVEIAMIGRDGMTGHGAVFGSETALCFTQISIAGFAYRTSAETVRQEFSRCRTLQNLLLEYSNAYTTQISKKVVCNNYHAVEQRFCTWLLMLYDRIGSDKLMLTHSQIACYLGVHRPSFTHTAKNLRETGIIDYARGHLRILNHRKLENTACECYRKSKNLF